MHRKWKPVWNIQTIKKIGKHTEENWWQKIWLFDWNEKLSKLNVWKSNDLYIRMISHSIKHTNVNVKWLTHKLVVYSHINYLIWKVSIYFNFRHYKLYFHKTFWQYIFSESKATRIFRRIEKKTLRSYSLVRFSFQSVWFLFVSKERYLHALFVFTQGIKLIKLNWH